MDLISKCRLCLKSHNFMVKLFGKGHAAAINKLFSIKVGIINFLLTLYFFTKISFILARE